MDLTTADALSPVEQSQLSSLETVIEKGMATFVEVGRALKEINDGRLYRERYGTFETYCKERWGIERRSAYQYITASRVADDIQDVNRGRHISFSQAREMARLSTPERQKLAAEVDFATTTRDDIKEIVREKFPVNKKVEVVDVPPVRPSYEGKWHITPSLAQKVDCLLVDRDYSWHEHDFGCLREGGSYLLAMRQIPWQAESFDGIYYFALLAIMDARSQWKRQIRSCWHPVWWFTKGSYVGDTVPDLFPSLKDAVLAITYEGDTICEVHPQNADLALAVLRGGRKYVGICPDAIDAERMTKILQEV